MGASSLRDLKERLVLLDNDFSIDVSQVERVKMCDVIVAQATLLLPWTKRWSIQHIMHVKHVTSQLVDSDTQVGSSN